MNERMAFLTMKMHLSIYPLVFLHEKIPFGIEHFGSAGDGQAGCCAAFRT